MADFPSLRPSTRRVKLGNFPKKTYTSLSGISTTRIFGTQAFGWVIEMSWRNTTGSNANEIYNHYVNQKGTRFYLPSAIFAGEGNLRLEAKMLALRPSLSWEYREPPDMDCVINDIYNISVVLGGELNYG
jgi:hypothetical protein